MQLPPMLQGESLKRLLQGVAFGVAATIAIGFYWGGWTLGSTAMNQARAAEQAGIVRVLAPICADRFQQSVDASANLEALKKTDSWSRNEFLEKAGWTKFPGSEPNRDVAAACINLINQVK